MDIFDKKLQEEIKRNEEICLWLSFCDVKGKLLGVIITKTLGISHAIIRTHELGINPGGQIKACEIDQTFVNEGDFDRLLSKVETIKAGYIAGE